MIGERWAQTGLIAGWHLNGDLNDFSGNSHTLTSSGSPSSSRGIFSDSYPLNGTSQYFTASNSTFLPTGDFTYEAWFKTSSTGTQTIMICDNAGGGAGITIRLNSNTNLQGRIMNNGSTVGNVDITGLSSMSDGIKHYVVFKRSGSSMALWLDGKSIGTATSTGNPNFNSTKNLYIGAYFSGSVDFFSGTLDEITVWNTALSDDKIRKNWGWSRGRYK